MARGGRSPGIPHHEISVEFLPKFNVALHASHAALKILTSKLPPNVGLPILN
jgi:hypothetical protein